MNRKEWAERLPLIQAFVEGKTVQVFSFGKWVDGNWEGKDDLAFESDIESYRIKPEPKVIWVSDDFNIFEDERDAVNFCQRQEVSYKKYVEVVE